MVDAKRWSGGTADSCLLEITCQHRSIPGPGIPDGRSQPQQGAKPVSCQLRHLGTRKSPTASRQAAERNGTQSLRYPGGRRGPAASPRRQPTFDGREKSLTTLLEPGTHDVDKEFDGPRAVRR